MVKKVHEMRDGSREPFPLRSEFRPPHKSSAIWLDYPILPAIWQTKAAVFDVGSYEQLHLMKETRMGLSGWSDPPSFVSSSGASSPTPLPEFFLAQRLQQSGLDMYGHRDSIEVAELYSHAMDYHSYPQSFNNEGSEDGRYHFYDDSESDPHETESTVVPSEDQTRARLSDIAWPRDGEEDHETPPAVPKSSGRFTCTSVDEEAQLITPSAATVAVGFTVDGGRSAPEGDVPGGVISPQGGSRSARDGGSSDADNSVPIECSTPGTNTSSLASLPEEITPPTDKIDAVIADGTQ